MYCSSSRCTQCLSPRLGHELGSDIRILVDIDGREGDVLAADDLGNPGSTILSAAHTKYGTGVSDPSVASHEFLATINSQKVPYLVAPCNVTCTRYQSCSCRADSLCSLLNYSTYSTFNYPCPPPTSTTLLSRLPSSPACLLDWPPWIVILSFSAILLPQLPVAPTLAASFLNYPALPTTLFDCPPQLP
jgi:hypothetical protein